MSRTALFLSAPMIAACGPAPAPCALTARALTTGRVHTDGLALRDELGRVVRLRGVNAGSRSKFAPYLPFDFTDGTFDAALADYLDRLQGFGVDVLRVPLTWAAVEPTQGTDDALFLQRFDAYLDAAWRRGIRTVVDFHQDVYAEAYCGDGFPPWTIPGTPPPPHHDCPNWFTGYATPEVAAAFDHFWAAGSTVQASYTSFWQRTAQRHAARGGVIGFELLNEPSAGTESEGTFETQTLSDFYARMVPLLNQWAPDALVFIDPAGRSSATLETALREPAGQNVVLAPHYYQPATIFGGDARASLVLADLQRWAVVAQGWGVPWFLGEWGAARAAPSSPDLVAAHHAAFDALGIGGAQWEYSVAKEGWNSEPLDLVDADGAPTPMTRGLLRPHVHAVAGTVKEERFDPTSRVYTLRYLPSGAQGGAAITEVLVPAAMDPAPTDITVTGGCYASIVAGKLLVQASGGDEVVVTVR